MSVGPENKAEEKWMENEAIAWFVRLREGATASDRKAFYAWLNNDPKNHVVFNEIKRFWADLEAPARFVGKAGCHRNLPSRWRGPLRKSISYAIGVSACLLIVAASILWRDAGLIDRLRADYATSPGERREIKLAEGTYIHLDGDTAIKVQLEANARKMQMLRGRVWLDVVPDKERPFTIAMNNVEVRVLGTAFAVDKYGAAIGVVVERGRVAISHRFNGQIEISGGQQVNISDDNMEQAISANAETALAWRRGLIVLDRVPLSRVIAEVQRIQRGRIIADESLANLTLTGVFRSDDPEAIIAAIQSTLGLRTISLPGVATFIYR